MSLRGISTSFKEKQINSSKCSELKNRWTPVSSLKLINFDISQANIFHSNKKLQDFYYSLRQWKMPNNNILLWLRSMNIFSTSMKNWNKKLNNWRAEFKPKRIWLKNYKKRLINSHNKRNTLRKKIFLLWLKNNNDKDRYKLSKWN